MEYVLSAYLFVMPIAGVLIAGMKFAYFEGRFPTLKSPAQRRENIGDAVLSGVWGALFWPVILPLEWCLSGFAYYGVWRVRKDRVHGR